ncbi:MAG: PEP-CTERM sorting domain-containing protein [Acidobacteriota bacterium]
MEEKLSRTILQLCLILTAFQASRATTITFSKPDGTPFGLSSLPQTCGDRATVPFSGSCSYTVGPEGATPNILLDYGNAPLLNSWTTANNFLTWGTGYGSLVDVVYAGASNYPGIKFEADAGYQLTLMQFDIAGYSGIARQVRWQVLDSSFSSLWDSGLVTAPASGSISLTPGSTGSTLYLIATEGTFFNTGLDNLKFSQSAIGQGGEIPEPSTYWMGFSGLALAAFRLRRN